MLSFFELVFCQKPLYPVTHTHFLVLSLSVSFMSCGNFSVLCMSYPSS